MIALRNDKLEVEVDERAGGDIVSLVPLKDNPRRVNLLDKRGVQIWLKHGDNEDPVTKVLSNFRGDFLKSPYRVTSSSPTSAIIRREDKTLCFTKEILLDGNTIRVSTEIAALEDVGDVALQLEYFNTFRGGKLAERAFSSTGVADGKGNISIILSEPFGQRYATVFPFDKTEILLGNKDISTIVRMSPGEGTECVTVMTQAATLMRGCQSRRFRLSRGGSFRHSIAFSIEKGELDARYPKVFAESHVGRNAGRHGQDLSSIFSGGPVFQERWAHLTFQYDAVKEDARKVIAELLAPLRYNGIIFEFSGGLRTGSHPELAEKWTMTMEDARSLVEFARDLGFAVGVEFNSPGHQNETRLKHVYPQLIEKGSTLCVSSEKAFAIVSDIIAEYVDAFRPDLFHFGADEAQFDGDECQFGICPACKGKAPHRLFADYIRRLNALLPEKMRRGLWGDMFLTHKQFGDTCWGNGSAGEIWRSIADIPGNMEIFDWHYFPSAQYGSIDYFMGRGFQTWAVSAFDFEGIRKFCSYAEERKVKRVLHTTWAVPNQEKLPIESMVWAAFYHWFGKKADEMDVKKQALEFCRAFWG